MHDRSFSVLASPPEADPVSAEEMLDRIVVLNRSNPDWWKDPEMLMRNAAVWGVRIREGEVMADYEVEEVARLSGACHASILVARTGCGLFASGYAARWGDGGCLMEPSVLSVPFDSAADARRAALAQLIASIGASRHGGRAQKAALLEVVEERLRNTGLFG